jgi:chitinase
MIAVIGLVFVVSMGTITVIELAAGKPMTSIVNGSSGSSGDTSIGNIFGSSNSTTTTTSTTKPDTSTTSSTTTSSTTTTSTSTTTTTTTQP